MEGQINTEADWGKNCVVVVNTAAWTAWDAQTETSGHVKHCRPVNELHGLAQDLGHHFLWGTAAEAVAHSHQPMDGVEEGVS